MNLTVNKVKQEVTAINDTTYGFGKPNKSVYPYVLHYYPNGTTDEADEHFIWEINVPVKITEPVQLTYSVKLVNKPTEKGNYQLDTNKIATLTPKDTDGNIYPTEEFPVPVVDYEVLETITPTVPEWEKSKSKTATNLDNNFESKVTLSLPSASYKGNLDVAFVLDGSTSTKKKRFGSSGR